MDPTVATTKLQLNTPQCTQSKSNITKVYSANLSNCGIILKVKFWLNFFHMWLWLGLAATGSNNFGSFLLFLTLNRATTLKKFHLFDL